MVLLLTGCQSQKTTKDPKKAVQVRTQLAAEYIKSGDLDAAIAAGATIVRIGTALFGARDYSK